MAEEKNNPLTDYTGDEAGIIARGSVEEELFNFWDKPFPDDMITENGNVAFFEKTYNKTHTANYHRRASLRIELEKADGSVELLDIGTFLMENIQTGDGDTSITLQDLAKPLMNARADKVKSGYQWYKNAPVKFLVSELLKTEYYDERNGEIPRGTILSNSRPASPGGDPLISTLGKPPSFGRLSNSFDTDMRCRAICACDLGIGDRLYMGLGNQLWEYDEEEQSYAIINTIPSELDLDFVIKKLWFNPTDSKLYGMAWEKETLVYENPITTDETRKYELPVGVDFIVFSYNGSKIDSLFDSTNAKDTNDQGLLKLFSGEYHIVAPMFHGKYHANSKYTGQYEFAYTDRNTELSAFYNNLYSVLSGIGNFDNTTNKIVDNQDKEYFYPKTENITIPYAQMCGFVFNRDPAIYYNMPTIQTEYYRAEFGKEYYDDTDDQDPWLTRILVNQHKTIDEVATRYTSGTDYEDRIHLFESFESGGVVTIDGLTTTHRKINRDTPISDGNLPTLEYEFLNDTNSVIGTYGSLELRKFYPGHLSFYEESVAIADLNEFSWLKAAWPWLKFSSGQEGSTTFLEDYGTNGGIFFCVVDKNYKYINNPADTGPKNIQQTDININGTYTAVSPEPYNLKFKYYIMDLSDNSINEIPALTGWATNYIGPLKSKDSFYQPTAITTDGSNIYIAGSAFNNVTENTSGGTSALTSLQAHRSSIIKVDSSLNFFNFIYNSAGADPIQYHTITDLLFIDNTTLLVSSYDRSKIVSMGSDDTIPSLSSPYGIYKLHTSRYYKDLTAVGNRLNDRFHEKAWQYGKMTRSLNEPDYFYCVSYENRKESNSNLRFHKIKISDGTGELQPLYVSDVATNESNMLSNLTLMYKSDFEIVFGITNGYYSNPITFFNSKNHLFKWDVFLSGIIELADFGNLSVWDALEKLASSFNQLMGFDGQDFFFIPKAISSTADILIDADIDKVVSIRKLQDVDVKNVITAVPYESKMGDVEWEIILTANESATAVDDNRVNIDAALRVRQDNDSNVNIIMKVATKGIIPEIGTETSSDLSGGTKLRFTYLVYHSVLETRFFRDVGASDTEIVLPTLFGEGVSDQIGIGDMLVVDVLNSETESDSFMIVRRIKSIDYNQNVVTIDALGYEFEAYTLVRIYRSVSLLNGAGEQVLRNNSWSHQGVTYVIDMAHYASGLQEGAEYKVHVASTNNLSVGTVVIIGDNEKEQIITYIEPDGESGYSFIHLKGFQSYTSISDPYNTIEGSDLVKAYWVPNVPTTGPESLVDVGGTGVHVGFEPGSSGSFWSNSEGEDRIEVKCPGLLLEAAPNAKYTAVDLDSIKKYGQIEEALPENRFMQKNLIEYLTRLHLAWKAKPKLGLEVGNFIQAVNNGGDSYSIPGIKFINASEKKMSKITVKSKKYFPRFEGNKVDFYLMEHSIDTKKLEQKLKLRAQEPY